MSSVFLAIMMTVQISSNTLVKMSAGNNKKLLTLEVDLDTLAEFSAARIIFGAKSNASLLHQQVVTKIREAKSLVSKEEFEEKVDQQKTEIAERSKRKSLERQKSLELSGSEMPDKIPIPPEQKFNPATDLEEGDSITLEELKNSKGLKKTKK